MSDTPRRQLPPLPNLGKLKRQAKAMLGEMRRRSPSAQLSEAQFQLAREYGFASWPALKAEVERISGDRNAAALREGGARLAFHRAAAHLRQEDGDPLSPTPFLGVGIATIVGFVLAALVGLVLLFATSKLGADRLLSLARRLVGHGP